jgi:hypothetical protein
MKPTLLIAAVLAVVMTVGVGADERGTARISTSRRPVFHPKNVNIDADDEAFGWDGHPDRNVVLKIQGKNANAAGTQRFGVVACNAGTSVLTLALFRPNLPKAMIVSATTPTNPQGPEMYTPEREQNEGGSDTIYAVLMQPLQPDGIATGLAQIGSEGYRQLSVTVSSRSAGTDPKVLITPDQTNYQCGVQLF